METKYGINEDKLDKLVQDIYSYVDRIKNTLDQINESMEKTKNVYKSNQANELRNIYNNFNANYPIVLKNIKGYAEDLVKVKSSYNKTGEEFVKASKLQMIDFENTFGMEKYNEH